jgi:hypothetical protein
MPHTPPTRILRHPAQIQKGARSFHFADPRTDSSIGCYSCSLPSGHFSARRAHEDLCCKMLLRCGPRKPCKRATRQFRKQNGTRKHINSSLFFNERNHRVRVRMFMCKSRLCGYISSSLFFDKINYHDFCYLTKRHLHNRTNFKKKTGADVGCADVSTFAQNGCCMDVARALVRLQFFF